MTESAAEPAPAEPAPAEGRAPACAERPDPAAEAASGAGHEPEAPAPLRVPRTPAGDPGVDALLERLADADHLTTDGHLAVYEDVHGGLRDALGALDARPGHPAAPR